MLSKHASLLCDTSAALIDVSIENDKYEFCVNSFDVNSIDFLFLCNISNERRIEWLQLY